MNKKGYFYFSAAIMIFSTLEVVSKSIVGDFNPFQLVFLRFLIGGLVLLPFAIIDINKKNIKITINDILILAGIAIIAVPLSMTFLQLAILNTKASIAAVLISSNAIFAAPFSYFILNEKMDKSIAISLILGIIGMFIIANPASNIGLGDFTGILYAIGSSITFALFNVLGKKVTPRTGGLVFNCIVFFLGSILMIPILLVVKAPVFQGIDMSNIFHVLYIGVVVTAIAYIFMFKGLSLIPANKGSLIFFVKPFLAGLLAYLALGETFSINLIAGTIFISAGILSAVISKGKDEIKEAA